MAQTQIAKGGVVGGDVQAVKAERRLAPMSILIVGLGLSLGAIAIAGLVFQLFAAPPEEPISGAFSQWPWVEATFMSGLFGFVGLGALFFPLSLKGL